MISSLVTILRSTIRHYNLKHLYVSVEKNKKTDTAVLSAVLIYVYLHWATVLVKIIAFRNDF